MVLLAGNTCITATKAVCEETYHAVRKYQTVGSRASLNAFMFPSAKKYVDRLLREEANSNNLKTSRRLAVVTGVTLGQPGYHVAEELAVSAAAMDVILVGLDATQLQQSVDAILEEFHKRHDKHKSNSTATASDSSSGSSDEEENSLELPQLYQVLMDPNSLQSVTTAAEEINWMARDYKGKLHILANMESQVFNVEDNDKEQSTVVTEEGVEVHMGQNYLAPRLLADLLLPLLRAAATSSYKPRLIQSASVGHCRGTDFDPHSLLRKNWPSPGAENETMDEQNPEETNDMNDKSSPTTAKSSSTGGGLELYDRSMMALMADTMALAREEPMLAVVTCDPGIVNYASTASTTTSNQDTAATPTSRLSLSRRRSSGSSIGTGSYFFMNLSPSQGARSALRAALDPDFNDDDNNSMQYLHCDGNPWIMADPTLPNPHTGKPYGLEEYSELVRDVGDELTGQLVADRACEVELCLSSSDVLSASMSSLLVEMEQSARHRDHDEDDGDDDGSDNDVHRLQQHRSDSHLCRIRQPNPMDSSLPSLPQLISA